MPLTPAPGGRDQCRKRGCIRVAERKPDAERHASAAQRVHADGIRARPRRGCRRMPQQIGERPANGRQRLMVAKEITRPRLRPALRDHFEKP
jgi:hypothetical protein